MRLSRASRNELLTYLLDPLERAGATFVQQFVWVLVGSGTTLVVTQNYGYAFDSAFYAAVFSLLTTLLTLVVPNQPAWLDLPLRIVKTAAQSIVGTLAADRLHTLTGADWRGAVAIAIPVTLTALLKGMLALAIPATIGASLLPARLAAAPVPLDLDYRDVTYLAPDGSLLDPAQLSSPLADPRRPAVTG